MTKQTKAEKRQYPRIEKSLPVEILANGYDFVTNTRNVSCAGTYCHVDKYIPPFTKVMVKLILPLMADDVKNGKCNIECKGVIVRAEDEKQGGFNIAIFFNEIDNGQRKKVSQYISQFLPKIPSGLKRL